MADTELTRGMRIRCKYGEARIVDVSDTAVKLGLSGGRYRWVDRPDLQIDQIIDGPPPDQRTMQVQVYDAACASLTDDVTLNPALLSWLVATCRVPEGADVPITLIGSAPVGKDALAGLLSRCGFVVSPSAPDTEILVVGRDDWNSDELKELLDLRSGESLRVYSQEMFLGWMISGCDPFQTKNPELIQRLAGSHDTLEFLKLAFAFDWPSTFVSPSRPNADGSFDAPETSYLKHEGYRVGKHGPSTAKRHDILRHCYLRGRVPSVFPDWYIEEWGTPASSVRLRKIAESIAAFCRNHKRLPSPSRVAIEDWELDLAWLYDNFYKGNYQFAWPGTSVW